jgi:hypothetical protein
MAGNDPSNFGTTRRQIPTGTSHDLASVTKHVANNKMQDSLLQR